jgi:DNA-binding beta-propeller fold protein YncE
MTPLAVTLALLVAAEPATEGAEPRPTVLDLQPRAILKEFLYLGSFQNPTAVHCDPVTGEVYVADAAGVIGIFDERGAPLFAFSDEEHLDAPRRLAVDAEGRIFAVGADTSSVMVFSYRGDFLEKIDVGAAAGQAVQVSALALDEAGGLWIGDSANGQVLMLSRDRKLRVRFGSPGTGPGEFTGITAIALDAKQVYVTDTSGLGVQVFTRHGRHLRGWGIHETGKANVSLPSGVAVDAAGRILLTDALRHEIKLFDPAGALLDLFGGFGRQPGDVSFPQDISIGKDGIICVAERGNARVQLLVPVIGLPSVKQPARSRSEERARRRAEAEGIHPAMGE